MRKIYSNPVPYDGPLSSEHTEYIGKPWQVFWHENCYMAVDCLGICKYHTTFLGATLPNFEDWPKVLQYNTGLEFTPREIWDIAERCNMIERLFNLREGLQREDLKKGDMLNHRYFDEPTDGEHPMSSAESSTGKNSRRWSMSCMNTRALIRTAFRSPKRSRGLAWKMSHPTWCDTKQFNE